jgi:eukaryotic-like serine/threonine-protein kinase
MSVLVKSRAATSDPHLPQVFGRYLLVQCLSRGGMGEIFLARHGLSGFEKLVVIKKVLPHLSADGQFISRFIDEAQVAIKLQHANVAQVFEVGRAGDEYFLSLEYVDGRDLRRTLVTLHERRVRFPVDLALFVAREMASGLSYAHRRTDKSGGSLELVHCDISPPNVMISFEGEVKIIDFGIAKSALRGTATDPQMGFGKFGYMAPEQLIRGGKVDHRTDIYATGVVLYELLTGHRLYEVGETPDYKALARMVARGQHPLPSHIDPALAPYDALVARALRPKPEERYQSAAELRDDLQHALVAINPTISSDNIAGFMRDLFASEVTEQQRLIARAEATDIEPWVEQLTTQSATTVSYALAHMPLVPPPDTRASRGLMAPDPPEGRTELVGRVAVPARSRRRARPAIIASAAVMLLVGGGLLAWALGSDRGERRQALAAAPPTADSGAADDPGAPDPTAAASPKELVLPADVVEPSVTAITPEPASPDPDSEAARPAPAEAKPSRPAARPRARKSKPDPAPAPKKDDAVSAKAVHAKFSKASSEYREFKAKYGERLEKDWADLATYMQFAKSGDKTEVLDKKIDRFRAKMRAARD